MLCCHSDKKIKNLSVWDLKLMKLGAMAFILVVVKGVNLIWNWDLLAHVSIWWFVVLCLVFCLKPCLKMCKKEKTEPTQDHGPVNQ